MSQSVLLLEKAKLEKLMSHYATFKVSRNAPGVIFAAKLPDAAITAYKSGKVLFQGGGALREAAIWGSNGTPSPKKASAKGETLPERLSELSVLGSDETGTGDFFGPVTVAACFVRADQIELGP